MQEFTRVETLEVARRLRALNDQMLEMMRQWTCEVGACQCCIATRTTVELVDDLANSFPPYCTAIGSEAKRLGQRLENIYAMVDQAANDHLDYLQPAPRRESLVSTRITEQSAPHKRPRQEGLISTRITEQPVPHKRPRQEGLISARITEYSTPYKQPRQESLISTRITKQTGQEKHVKSATELFTRSFFDRSSEQ